MNDSEKEHIPTCVAGISESQTWNAWVDQEFGDIDFDPLRDFMVRILKETTDGNDGKH